MYSWRTCVGQHPGLGVTWHVNLDGAGAAVETVPLKVIDTLQPPAQHSTDDSSARQHIAVSGLARNPLCMSTVRGFMYEFLAERPPPKKAAHAGS
jgi:hypothetical protein